MSNDDQKTSVTDNEPEPMDEQVDQQPAGEVSATNNGSKAGIIAAVIVLGIFTFAAYYWHQNYYVEDQQALFEQLEEVAENQDSMESALAAASADAGLEEAIDGLVANQKKLEANLKARMDMVAAQGKKLAETQQKLQQSVAGLYKKEDQSSFTWVLAEAEYLVLAATQRLALEGDINTAIKALKAADERLKSADHPDLIPIRDQLIEDAAALEAVKLPDIEGLAIYLAKVIKQVKDLPTKQIAESLVPFSGTKSLADDAKQWSNVAKSMWTDLVKLVEVKDAALPDSVLFDPEMKYFLEQNLRLELASARLSALRRDGENFRASVGLVKDMLNDFFETSAPKVKSIIARLDEAETFEFEPELPKISGSLNVIRAHSKAKPTTRSAK